MSIEDGIEGRVDGRGKFGSVWSCLCLFLSLFTAEGLGLAGRMRPAAIGLETSAGALFPLVAFASSEEGFALASEKGERGFAILAIAGIGGGEGMLALKGPFGLGGGGTGRGDSFCAPVGTGGGFLLIKIYMHENVLKSSS